jgi:hypothetical protein
MPFMLYTFNKYLSRNVEPRLQVLPVSVLDSERAVCLVQFSTVRERLPLEVSGKAIITTDDL